MKYELTDETIKTADGAILYRIKALKDFGCIKKGQLGGFVQSYDNLDQTSEAWIANEAKVWGKSLVTNDSQILHEAEISGDCAISRSEIGNECIVHGKSIIDECTIIHNAEILDSCIYKSLINSHSKIDESTIRRSCITGNTQIKGCEVYNSAVIDSDLSHYRLDVCHFERISNDEITNDRLKDNPVGEMVVSDGITHFKHFTLVA